MLDSRGPERGDGGREGDMPGRAAGLAVTEELLAERWARMAGECGLHTTMVALLESLDVIMMLYFPVIQSRGWKFCKRSPTSWKHKLK